MAKPSEFEIQRAFHWWFAGLKFPKNHPQAGQWRIIPAKIPGIVSWHTPNGEKRDGFTAKRLNEMGVLAGIPDYFMLWGRLHALEFKDDEGRLSPAQIALRPQLIAAGAWVEVVDNLNDAKRKAISWGLAVDSKHTA
jgi:hypothetical protein